MLYSWFFYAFLFQEDMIGFHVHFCKCFNEALWASLQPDCPRRMFCCSAEMPLSKYACPWAVICYMYECHWRICEACGTGRRVAWMMRGHLLADSTTQHLWGKEPELFWLFDFKTAKQGWTAKCQTPDCKLLHLNGMVDGFPVSRLLEMRSDALALYPKITKLHKQVWLAGGETHRIWVDLNMFYNSTWFFQAFPSISHWISPKSFLLEKNTQCGLKKTQEASRGFSRKVCLEGDRLATDATLFEESCALSLSKGKRGLGPLWMRKLPGNSGVSTEVSMQ